MPTLSTRLGVAARALVGIFNEQSGTQAHGMLGGIFSGSSGDPPYRGTSNILSAYSTMPWLRAVAQRVATSVAASSTQWRLYAPSSGQRRDVRIIQRAGDVKTRRALIQKADNGLDVVESHILLDALNAANSYMVGQSLFKVTQLHLDLVGESFWIKERNAFGAPVAFWPVPPDWIEATPTPASRSYRVSFAAWQGTIPDTEVLWMADLDPANPYGRGTGLARSLSDELETDEYAAKHTRQLFFNRARPDMIIWPKSQGAHDIGLQPDQVRRLEERWLDGHQGFWRAFKPFFVGREIQVHEVNQSLQELQLVELRKHERDTIVQVFGIPPELLGILNNSNRATIESADYLFSRWVITPRLEFLRAQLQERLIPEYDDRLVLDFVSPVEEDRAHMLAAAKAAPWAMKVDEWRTLQGQEVLDDDAGQVHMMPLNLIPVMTPSVPPAPVPATVAGETPPEGDVVSAAWRDDLAFFTAAGDDDAVRLVREFAAEGEEFSDLWQVLGKQEPGVARMVQRHLVGLGDRVTLEQVASVETSEQLEQYLDLDGWLDDLKDAMVSRWRRAWWTGAEIAAQDVDIAIVRVSDALTKAEDAPTVAFDAEIGFNVVNPSAVEYAVIHGTEFINEIAYATRIAVKAAVATALTEGLGVAPLKAQMLKMKIGLTTQQQNAVEHYEAKLEEAGVPPSRRAAKVNTFRKKKIRLRAMTIARTELAHASANGQEALWSNAAKEGVLDTSRLRRKWMTASHGIVCPVCIALGKLKPIPFVKSFSAAGFNGKNAPAHPNCRCTVGLVRSKKA